MIEPGQQIPDTTLHESTGFGEACPLRPEEVPVRAAVAGKRVVIFGLPGAYTPTCSARHLPGYLEHLDALKAKGVDEVWCVSVNDGYVMAAWGKELGAHGKIRMLGDGRAEFAEGIGLAKDMGPLGVRVVRFSMLVDDGVVKQVNVEPPGEFGVSSAETMLEQLG